MPKGFTEYEKEIINAALLREGKTLFSTFGLKKTSIHDLTRAVGIAQGSFYNFYQSKEELYFEILELEEKKIKQQFQYQEIKSGADPKTSIKNLLIQTLELIEKSPFFRQLYVDNSMEAIVRKLPKHRLEEHFKKDSNVLLPIIQKWQQEGIILNKNPEVISGLLRSLFVLTLHKKEIGESVYTETMELLIELIVDGIVIQEEYQ